MSFFFSQGSVKVSYVIVVVAAIKQTVGEQVINGLYCVLICFSKINQTGRALLILIREDKHK